MKRVFFAIAIVIISVNLAKSQTHRLQINGAIIKFAQQRIELDKNGFPKQLQIINKQDSVNNLLAENIHFHFVRKIDGKNIAFRNDSLVFISRSSRNIQWKLKSISDSLQMDIMGAIKASGQIDYIITVTALGDLSLKDVTMHIPMGKVVASYIKGLGKSYGPRPEKIDWKWSVPVEEIWLGSERGGLKYTLYDKNFNPTKKTQKPKIPVSWANNGRGGIVVGIKGSSMLANNYTGEYQIKKGEVLYYNFSISLTTTSPTAQ